MSLELIEAYMNEVRQRLPRGKRDDLEPEIRSLIEGTLKERCKAEEREPDETMVVDVLQSFGPPEKVAASYLPDRYLIGPQLFPTFVLVVRIVLIVMAVIALVRLGISMGQITDFSIDRTAQTIAANLADYVSSALQAFGNIVLIFAILQWVMPELKVREQAWNPRTLKGRGPGDQLKIAGLVWDTAWMGTALLLFNFHPDAVAVHSYNATTREWAHVPLLTQAFSRYLPSLNLVWFLGIVLNLVLIRRGRWEPATRWLRIARGVLLIVVLIVMASGPAILKPFATVLAAMGWPDRFGELVDLVPQIGLNMRLVLGLIAVLEGVELIKHMRQWGWLGLSSSTLRPGAGS